ncbi:hypothetical protein FRC00_007014, partial [Tulasnella sp. 408]
MRSTTILVALLAVAAVGVVAQDPTDTETADGPDATDGPDTSDDPDTSDGPDTSDDPDTTDGPDTTGDIPECAMTCATNTSSTCADA